ncbi:MAG: hypothetical protein AB1631_00360 [Acidobacteriota bacterium]
MNVLDENIIASQRKQLESWKIHFRRIGDEVGHLGMKDMDEIIPLLHALHRPTFFTMDEDFYRPQLLHAGYCLVYLDVYPDEAAQYIRRFLRFKGFRTQAQRMGKVIRLRHTEMDYRQIGIQKEIAIHW